MKVALTGASGFIGSALRPALARQGHEVLAIDARRSAGASLQATQALIHLAGIAHRHASRQELDDVNVRLTEQMARLALAAEARFLFLSSVKVHGEESHEAFSERSPIEPQDAYGASKARAEDSLRAIAGLQLTVIRPPLVYGPGVKANFLALMQAIARGWPLPLGSIDNRRSFIYVGNLADAIVRCLETDGTYLVSDGEAVSTPQLCREIGSALDRPARLLSFPPALLPRKLTASLEIDDRAIRERLGWQPPFTRAQGLRATAQWHRTGPTGKAR